MLIKNAKKPKRVAFQTMYAEELHRLIGERMMELARDGQSTPRSATASPELGASDDTAPAEPLPASAGGAAAADIVPNDNADTARPVEPLDSESSAETARTIWVGGIPADLVPENSEDYLQSSPLAHIFAGHGTVTSLTVRRKEGENKNWAFVTFTSPSAASAALSQDYSHNGLALQVKPANVEQQLRSPSTGALARIWQKQKEKEAVWMASLLQGLKQDTMYQTAKADVAKSMGLRVEEMEDELEEQELEQIAMSALEIEGDDVDGTTPTDPGDAMGEQQPEPEAEPNGGESSLGLPPAQAAPVPSAIDEV